MQEIKQVSLLSWILGLVGAIASHPKNNCTNFVTIPFPIPSEYDVRNTTKRIVRKIETEHGGN